MDNIQFVMNPFDSAQDDNCVKLGVLSLEFGQD